jgi:hypothetical protein
MKGLAKTSIVGLIKVILLAFIVEGCSKNDLSPSACQLGSYQIGAKGTSNYSYNNYFYNSGQLTGGQDLNGVYTFSYDEHNRITQIDYNEGKMCSIQYDGNGRISYEIWIYKPPSANNIIWIGPPAAPIIYRFSYNSSGQLITQKAVKLNTPGDSSVLQIMTFQYPNANTHNYSSSSWLTYGSDTVTTNLTYEYDDKINPFLQNGYNLTSGVGATDNNVTQVAMTAFSKQKILYSDYTYNFTYTYTNAGYPLTQIFTSNAVPSESSVSTFSYTNCH